MRDGVPRGGEATNLAFALFAPRQLQCAPRRCFQLIVARGDLERAAHCGRGVALPRGGLGPLEQRFGNTDGYGRHWTGSKVMNNTRLGMFKRRAGPPPDQPAYTRFDNSSPGCKGVPGGLFQSLGGFNNYQNY